MAVIVAGAFALFLVGNGRAPLWDRDEPRYAECSREMLRSGDWVVPRFLGDLRPHKPPLIYWCQLAAMSVFGDKDYAARLPSSVAVALVAAGLGAFAWRFAGPRRAAWAAFVFSTCIVVIAAAKMCITDAVLLLWIAIGQACLFVMWGKGRRGFRVWGLGYRVEDGKRTHLGDPDAEPTVSAKRSALDSSVRPGAQEKTRAAPLHPKPQALDAKPFSPASSRQPQTLSPKSFFPLSFALWVSTALAILTKGPVVLGMHASTILVLATLDVGKEWRTFARWKVALAWTRRTRPLLGLIVVAVLVAPWVVMVSRRAPEFLPRLLHRTRKYASSGAEGHAEPPGFYLLTIWGTMFPWCLMLPTALGIGIRHRRAPLLRFALAAAIGPWLVMELVPNKLPFYILPSFPALAVLAAEAIVRSSRAPRGTPDDDLKRPAFMAGVAGWGIAVVGLGVAPWLAERWIGRPQPGVALLSIAAAVYLAVVAIAFARRRVRAGSAAMGVGMAVVAAVLFANVLPNITTLGVSRSIGAELNALGAGGDTPVAMIDYREPSLAFYQGGGAREREDGYLSADSPEQWVVLTTTAWSHVPPDVQARFHRVGPPRKALMYAGQGKSQDVMQDVIVVRRRER